MPHYELQIDEPLPIFLDYETRTVEDAMLTLGRYAIDFAAIERVPRYTPETRENDAEHSFMLALIATEIAARFFPQLDSGLVSQFSTVHDLVELKTGDTATFDLDETELAAKHTSEADAMHDLLSTLPSYTASLLRRYEYQIEPEARFVRLMDKILPVIVDILGPGTQVMAEDYGVTTSERLAECEDVLRNRFAAMFPEPKLNLLHAVRTVLADRFADSFQPA